MQMPSAAIAASRSASTRSCASACSRGSAHEVVEQVVDQPRRAAARLDRARAARDHPVHDPVRRVDLAAGREPLQHRRALLHERLPLVADERQRRRAGEQLAAGQVPHPHAAHVRRREAVGAVQQQVAVFALVRDHRAVVRAPHDPLLERSRGERVRVLEEVDLVDDAVEDHAEPRERRVVALERPFAHAAPQLHHLGVAGAEAHAAAARRGRRRSRPRARAPGRSSPPPPTSAGASSCT